jgi:phage antirepressor YoqD-like protein
MNDQISIFEEPEKKMFLTQVAGALGVTDRTIQRYVKKLFPGLMKNGRATALSELQVTKIKLELAKAKNLDSVVELPKTALEKKLLVKQAYDILNEEIEELKNQLEEAQPKIEFHKQVGDSTGLYSVGQAAKVLSMGRNKFFELLRDESIFFDREPYQRYIDRGYFVLKTTVVNDHMQKQAFVTGKGLQWLQKRFYVKQCFKCGGQWDVGKDLICPHCGVELPF